MIYPTSFTEGSINAIDQLIAGNSHLLLSKKRTLQSGTLARGAVLGIDRATQTAAIAADADNTGNADISGVTVTPGRAAEPGVYVLRCTAASTDAGTFEVRAPDGTDVGDLTVASAFTSEHINLTVPDGTTDWDTGDLLYVTVSDDGTLLLSAVAATDGSAEPVFILAENADASEAEAECMVYAAGDFNARSLSFGAGHSAATVRENLLKRGIRIIDSLEANNG